MDASRHTVSETETRLAQLVDDHLAAVERGAAPDRAALLAAHPEFAADIEACLASLDFLRAAATGDLAADGNGATALGDFRIVRELGRGGMGIVYEAHQQSLDRRVALKVLLAGRFARPDDLRRFRIEAEAAAQLDHPNIVPVFEVGEDAGTPFFSMKLLPGGSLTDQVHGAGDSNPPPEESARLVAAIARAVHHAHQRGILHRDLKPSNILLDAVGQPFVTDFGLARRLADDSTFTESGALLGSPAYMAPEQAAGTNAAITTLTDVYGLGTILYALLTGKAPFAGYSALETLALVKEAPPEPPRRIVPAIDRDLETICLKCLQKEPALRYASAEALADDLERWLRGEPIAAVPPSRWYRVRKFARRHRTMLTTAALVTTVAAAAVGIGAWSMGRVRQADNAVEQSKREIRQRHVEARRHRYAADIRQAYQFVQLGLGIKAIELLRRHLPRSGEEDERDFTWHYMWRLCHHERQTLRGHKGAVYHAEFTPDGRSLASCGQDGTVGFWDVATGRCLRTIAAHDTEVNWVAFSRDGRRFATVADDGCIKQWDAVSLAHLATIPAHKGDAVFVQFTPAGDRLISGGRDDGMVKVWDAATRRELASVRWANGKLECIALSADGTTFAVTGADGVVKAWDLSDLHNLHLLTNTWWGHYGLAISADGTRLAVEGPRHSVRLLDSPGGRVRDDFLGEGHAGAIYALAFTPDGRMIASASEDGSVRLWDSATGRCLGTLLGHETKVWSVSVSPDGTTLATASSDGTVKLWDARPPQDRLALLPATGRMLGELAFASDGQSLIAARARSENGSNTLGMLGHPLLDAKLEVFGFDIGTGTQRFHHLLQTEQETQGVHLAPDGSLVLFRTRAGKATTWDASTGKRTATFVLPVGEVQHLPQGRYLTVRRSGYPVKLVDPASGQTRRVLPGTEFLWRQSVFSSDGDFLVGVDQRHHLHVWDAVGNRARPLPPGHHTWNWGAAAFSPDGTILAVGDTHLDIQLWDVRTLQRLGTLSGHSGEVWSLTFSPDGRTLVSGSGDQTLKFWDIAAREELLSLRAPCHYVQTICFSPDGRTLAYWVGADKGQPSLYVLPTGLSDGSASDEGQ